MSQISVWTAFLAGVVSFLSPCVLPLVPGYISFISGMSLEELARGTDKRAMLRRAGLGSIFFVLGFALVFTLLGASASAVGRFLEAYMPVLSKIAGIVIILFGLHTMGIVPIRWLYYEYRLSSEKLRPGWAGAFAMGFAFAFGWTPCIGPILSGILALAAAQATIKEGMLLLFIYSLGLGIPFIITGFATASFLQFFNRYKRYIRWGEIAAGALLVVAGVLIFSNQLTKLIALFPRWLFKFSL